MLEVDGRGYIIWTVFFCWVSTFSFCQCTLILFGGSLLNTRDFWKWTSPLGHWIWHMAQINFFNTFHPLDHSDLVQGWAKDQGILSKSKTSQTWDLMELYLASELAEVTVWTLRMKLAQWKDESRKQSLSFTAVGWLNTDAYEASSVPEHFGNKNQYIPFSFLRFVVNNMQIKETSLMEAVSFWGRERAAYVDLCILKEDGWVDVWEQHYRLFAFPGVLCIHSP